MRIQDDVQALPFRPQNPYMLQYNLVLQREVFPETVFTVGYVGSHGVKLLRVVDENTAIPQILPDRSGVERFFFPATATRRNPRFAIVRNRRTDASSFYNSLQFSVNRRSGRGFQFQASYTYSHSVDDGSGVLGSVDNRGAVDYPVFPEDHKSSRGLSSFDLRHNFSFNYTYDLPAPGLAGVARRLLGGWQLNGIAKLSTGVPFTVRIGFNRSRNRATGPSLMDRPNLVSGRDNNPVLGDPNGYFDPTAFELPAAGFHGNLGRNTIISPGLASFDFSLVKNNRIAESKNVQFRAEFFNLLNRANFDIPAVLNLFTPQATRIATSGRITSTITTARQIQFGLKFLF